MNIESYIHEFTVSLLQTEIIYEQPYDNITKSGALMRWKKQTKNFLHTRSVNDTTIRICIRAAI